MKDCLVTRVNQTTGIYSNLPLFFCCCCCLYIVDHHCQIFVRVTCSYEPLWEGTSTSSYVYIAAAPLSTGTLQNELWECQLPGPRQGEEARRGQSLNWKTWRKFGSISHGPLQLASLYVHLSCPLICTQAFSGRDRGQSSI